MINKNFKFSNIDSKLSTKYYNDLVITVYLKDAYISAGSNIIVVRSYWRIFLMYINFNKIL